MANVCQHHKYGFCKFLDKCKYKHVNENCNDKSCEINDCEKRHPMLCRYFKEFGRSTIHQLKLDMFNVTSCAALGDSSPESVSFSDIPQLDGANCMSEIQNPNPKSQSPIPNPEPKSQSQFLIL